MGTGGTQGALAESVVGARTWGKSRDEAGRARSSGQAWPTNTAERDGSECEQGGILGGAGPGRNGGGEAAVPGWQLSHSEPVCQVRELTSLSVSARDAQPLRDLVPFPVMSRLGER